MTLARLHCFVLVRCVLFVVAAMLPLRLAAQNYSFVNIDYPGAMYTFPQAVNDSGHVVGYWGDSQGNNHGFYWTVPTSPASTIRTQWGRFPPGSTTQA